MSRPPLKIRHYSAQTGVSVELPPGWRLDDQPNMAIFKHVAESTSTTSADPTITIHVFTLLDVRGLHIRFADEMLVMPRLEQECSPRQEIELDGHTAVYDRIQYKEDNTGLMFGQHQVYVQKGADIFSIFGIVELSRYEWFTALFLEVCRSFLFEE